MPPKYILTVYAKQAQRERGGKKRLIYVHTLRAFKLNTKYKKISILARYRYRDFYLVLNLHIYNQIIGIFNATTVFFYLFLR
jgi:hypothetical protein